MLARVGRAQARLMHNGKRETGKVSKGEKERKRKRERERERERGRTGHTTVRAARCRTDGIVLSPGEHTGADGRRRTDEGALKERSRNAAKGTVTRRVGGGEREGGEREKELRRERRKDSKRGRGIENETGLVFTRRKRERGKERRREKRRANAHEGERHSSERVVKSSGLPQTFRFFLAM